MIILLYILYAKQVLITLVLKISKECAKLKFDFGYNIINILEMC